MPTPKWLFNLPCDEIYNVSNAMNLDWHLVAAICITESAGDRYAWRYEPKFTDYFKAQEFALKCRTTETTEVHGQMFSYGLMQIMGATLRRLGFSDSFGQAFNPIVNLKFAGMLLTQLKSQYSDMYDQIAAYNAGKPRKGPDGKYLNQAYVDRVTKLYSEL